MAPRISSYMRSPVYVVSPTDSLAYARNYMLKKEISRVVVVNDTGIPVGILTVTDIIETLFGRNYQKTLDSILVNEVMTSNPIVIEESKSIKTASYLMLRHKIGGLPVVDKRGKLIGMLTKTDVARAFYERYKGKFVVSDLMRRDFTTALSSHSIFYIARLLETDPSGKVIVIDSNNKPIGVIAKKDLAYAQLPISALITRGKDRYIKTKIPDIYRNKIVSIRMYLVPIAEDIMSNNPLTINLDEDASKAAELIVRENIGVLPVTDESNTIKGTITKLEFLNVFAKS